jgi:hypothetical protein
MCGWQPLKIRFFDRCLMGDAHLGLADVFDH